MACALRQGRAACPSFVFLTRSDIVLLLKRIAFLACMFTKKPLHKRSTLLRRFFKPEIYPEAYFAYFKKLPNEIQVNWFRDEGMIIGKVNAGGKEFMTQGEDADDFIKMVNESIVTAFNIPEDYFDIVSQTKSY